MEKVYEVTKPGRLNKRKVLGKESRAVLIKNAMLKVFRNLFMKKKTYPTLRGEIDPKRQMEIDSINKNIEETKKKMDILRNKEGELTLAETKNLHIFNKQLEQMKKMKLVREHNYVRFEKIKNFFAYRPDVQTLPADEMENQHDDIQSQIETDLTDKKLEEELKKEVQDELNNQEIPPVANIPAVDEVPVAEEQKVEAPIAQEEQPEKPVVEQEPVKASEVSDKSSLEVNEAIKKANVLIEKAAKADKLEGDVNKLTSTVAQKDAEIEKLKEDNDRLTKEAQAKENDWKQEILRVRNELDGLTKRFNLLDEGKKAVERELAISNKEKADLEGKYNNAVQNIQNLMVRNDELTRFYDILQPALETQEEQHYTK